MSGVTMLRMQNMILAGGGGNDGDDIYLQCYKGSLDLDETIETLDLTGTLTASIGDLQIVGSGTLFTIELRSGQMFFAGDDMFMVNTVIDDTHLTVYRGPISALVASTGERLSILFEINRQRGTMSQGNAVEFDKGTIIGTGWGTLRLNGAELDTVTPINEPKGVGTGADDNTVGTVTWNNPGNITTSGGSGADCAPADAEITHYLKGTNCGFSAIPGGATITGISVAIRKQVTGATTETVSDSRVSIVKADGSIGTTNRASLVSWPATYAYTIYGGQDDLWDEAWAPADFADADVGAVISATVADPGGDLATLNVEYMFLTVYYTTSGGGMDFTGSPLIAIYDDVNQTYAVADLNFATPTVAPTLTDESGGTAGMQAGDYSLRLVPSSTVTQGYGNPGPRANVSLVSADDQIGVDVTLVPMDTVSLQDGWDVYATETSSNPNQGPWSFVRTVPDSEIDPSTHTFNIEYLDAEIARQGLLDFDNDPVPPSGFIAVIEGNPMWVSCFGRNNLSPGPSLVPAKPQNIEAAPANWNVTSSPPQYLLGVIESLARLYLPTPASLQQGVWNPTGDPLIPPLSLRPYWHMGFAGPYQIVFALGWLIGYPHGGPTKSIADAEDAKAQFFGGYVAEITKNWVGAHVLVGWDQNPMVNAICFFHSADSLNSDGFWTTRVLVWGLNQGDWIGDVLLTDSTRDMIVTGVASVDNQLVFLAGGRTTVRGGIGPVQIDTFNWNESSGNPIDYYAAWQLQSGGILDRNKSVKTARASGQFTNAVIKLYGFDSNTAENLSDIEAGTNSLVTLPLTTTTDVETTTRERLNIPSLFTFTPRVSGTYSGSGEPDRLNGAVVEFLPSGNRR
jgi:hypothetical protein